MKSSKSKPKKNKKVEEPFLDEAIPEEEIPFDAIIEAIDGTILENEPVKAPFKPQKRKTNRESTFYIDHVRFTALTEEYAKAYREALAAGKTGKDLPRMSEELGMGIKLICENMAKRPNYSGYSYLDEMIGDAIINATKYLWKYEAAKIKTSQTGAFNFVSFMCARCFGSRIMQERKETQKKQKFIEAALNRETRSNWWGADGTNTLDQIRNSIGINTKEVAEEQEPEKEIVAPKKCLKNI